MEEQLVIFRLAGEVYGVDVGRVQSIIQMQRVTVIPGAPGFIEGVINLRGAVIPVVDLRTRFALKVDMVEHKPVIIVVELGNLLVGLIVDKVLSVTKIPTSTIEPPSPLLTGIDTSYLRGIARLDQQVMILLDLDRIFALDEQQAFLQAV